MKISSLSLWLRLSLGSAIGAIVYRLSPGSKTEKLRKKVRARIRKREGERKSEIYTLSADTKR